jgi:hypothetical protein
MGVQRNGWTFSRNKQLVQASLAVLVAILIFCAAGDVGLAKLRIFPALVELPIGASVSLHVSDASGTVRSSELQWVSDNPQIVTVSPGGYITALSVGETSVEVFSVRDSSQRAFCRVVVVEAGPTLLYPTDPQPTPPDAPDFPPDTPPDAPSDQPFDIAGDDEIPVEHDSDLDLPVERLPEIDEFIWTIRVHDSITQDASDPDFPIKLVYTLDLQAVKVGGRTSRGEYEGTATFKFEADTSELSEQILGAAGGYLVKLLVQIGGQYQADDLSIQVEAYDRNKYTDFASKPGEPGIVPLVKYAGMALGSARFVGFGTAGGSSLDASGVGINLQGPTMTSGGPINFKLTIGSSGNVQINLVDLGLRRQFSGQLSRKPIVPN